MKVGDKVTVTQTRSEAGRDGRFRATLKAIGLTGIGTKRTVVINEALFGMLKKVESVIKVAV